MKNTSNFDHKFKSSSSSSSDLLTGLIQTKNCSNTILNKHKKKNILLDIIFKEKHRSFRYTFLFFVVFIYINLCIFAIHKLNRECSSSLNEHVRVNLGEDTFVEYGCTDSTALRNVLLFRFPHRNRVFHLHF